MAFPRARRHAEALQAIRQPSGQARRPERPSEGAGRLQTIPANQAWIQCHRQLGSLGPKLGADLC